MAGAVAGGTADVGVRAAAERSGAEGRGWMGEKSESKPVADAGTGVGNGDRKRDVYGPGVTGERRRP